MNQREDLEAIVCGSFPQIFAQKMQWIIIKLTGKKKVVHQDQKNKIKS